VPAAGQTSTSPLRAICLQLSAGNDGGP
jgi:hypothetical protein